jgi:hypothetical protein
MSSYVVESATKFKFYALGEAEAKGGGRNWRVHAPHFSQRLLLPNPCRRKCWGEEGLILQDHINALETLRLVNGPFPL